MKNIDELKITDDILFGAVLTADPEIARQLAERVTGRKIRKILSLDREKVSGRDPIRKHIRMDVIFYDSEAVYVIEMLMYRDKALPERLRYYASANDMDQLKPGMLYSELKHMYVICICGYDPFGRNWRKYHFRRCCIREPEIELNDGCDIIILNINGEPEDNSNELNSLLDFMKTGDPGEDELNRRIENTADTVLNDKEWREQLMDYYLTRYGAKVADLRRFWNTVRHAAGRLQKLGFSGDELRKMILEDNPDLSEEEYEIILGLKEDIPENDERVIEEYLKRYPL